MTDPEFDTWLDEHTACFTGVSSWLIKFPTKARRPGDITADKVLEKWRNALRYVSLEDALEASRMIHDRRADLPGSFDEHPGAVARIARKTTVGTAARGRVIDGEITYRCFDCEDTGLVTVWHPDAIAWAKSVAMSDLPDFDEQLDVPEKALERLAKLPKLCGPMGEFPITRTRTLQDCEAWQFAVRQQHKAERWSMFCSCDAGSEKRFGKTQVPVFDRRKYLKHDTFNPKALFEFARGLSKGVEWSPYAETF